jgi:peptidyl-prolyl cis-trans isomerase B (cyclophilin B)
MEVDALEYLGIVVLLTAAALVAVPASHVYAAEEAEVRNPLVTMDLGELGVIKVELFPDVAPNTVINFISLVQAGFYDGVIFHRVIPGFMIQGGDPTGTGMGGPGYSIRGEFSQNGFENSLKHERGVISMARTSVPDSAGSQFFIMVADHPHLDGSYAAFGRVVEGMEVADRIASVQRDRMDRPFEDQRIEKITVDTFGTAYPEPEKL